MVKQNRHFSFFAIILMVLMTSYSCEKMDESEKGAQSPDKIKAQQENAIKIPGQTASIYNCRRSVSRF